MDGGRLRWQSGFSLSALLDGQGTASSLTLGQAKRQLSKSVAATLSQGTGAGQVNAVVVREDTVNASSSLTYDLFDSTLLDVFDVATAFQTIKFVWLALIDNPDGTTGASSVTVGNAAAEPHQLWFGADAHTASVFPGGLPFCQGDPTGKTVDASNNRVLVTNNDGANKATWLVVFAGRRV